MVTFSFATGLFYVWAVRYPNMVAPQAGAVICMMTKGVWFFIVARILFSGDWGYNGMEFMPAMCWTVAGMLIVVMYALFGLFIAMKYDYEYYDSNAGSDNGSEFSSSNNGKYGNPEEEERLNGHA